MTKSHFLRPWLDQVESSDEKQNVPPLQATSFSGRKASVWYTGRQRELENKKNSPRSGRL